MQSIVRGKGDYRFRLLIWEKGEVLDLIGEVLSLGGGGGGGGGGSFQGPIFLEMCSRLNTNC